MTAERTIKRALISVYDKTGLAELAQGLHAAGVANGGTTCEDPPGFREGPVGKLYLAYLRDPDGNKLCALHRPSTT